MSKNRRREQAPKHSNRAMYDAMQELRRSNAAVPHKNHKRDDRAQWRKQKQNRKWED